MGVYCHLCCIHLVSVCVLLNMSLYLGNRFCMYLVDFDAVIFVSCIIIIVGLCVMSWCRFGRVVFRDAAFHVVMCVLCLVDWLLWGCVGGSMGICVGWEYSFIGSLCFNVSLSKVSGRKGNLFVSVSRFMFWLFSSMKLYISLWIEFGGFIRFWFVCVNNVYGCVVSMCLSGGFCSSDIRSNSNVVQSGVGGCLSS